MPRSPFTEFVDAENLVHNDDDASKCLERSLENVLNSNITNLRRFFRKTHIPFTHPSRVTLWLKLLKIRHSVDLSASDYPEFDQNQIELSTSMAGYELSNQLLLPTYRLNANGQQCLKMILHKLCIDKPELVFVPELWPITALLLHYHAKPSMVYAILQFILNQPDFIAQTKSHWKSRCLVLQQIAKSRKLIIPCSIENKQSKNSTNHDLEMAKWLIALWNLPLNFLVSLMDIFLIDGPKIFYRAGLVLLQIFINAHKSYQKNSAALVATNTTITTTIASNENNNTNTSPDYDSFPSNLLLVATDPVHDLDHFFKKMFGIRNFQRDTINHYLAKVSKLEKNLNLSFDPDQELIKPCDPNNSQTFVSYLLNNSTATTANNLTDGSTTPIHPSDCVTPAELAQLIRAIDDNHISRLTKPYLLFSSNVDGSSLKTLFKKAADSENQASLLLVRSTSRNSIIGAYCSDRWALQSDSGYFGNGTCYLARVRPAPLTIYHWVGRSELNRKQSQPTLNTSNDPSQLLIDLNSRLYQRFQRATSDGIEIGGSQGTSSPGLSLDSQLSVVSSGPSPVFANPCLITDHADLAMCASPVTNDQKTGQFTVSLIELIGFADM